MIENKPHPEFKIWPIHPQPLEDEVLSSWMIRLAHANGFKAHDFYALYFGKDKQIWNRDIDHLAPDWLINGLSYYTGVSVERIYHMTLRSYEGIVFEKFNEKGISKGLLPLGIYHRLHKAYGQQFCPMCLLEDKIPYMRKLWRVAYVTSCKKHKIFLHDRCDNCKKPIMSHRIDMKQKNYLLHNINLRFCGSCIAPISTNILEKPNFYELKLQKQIQHSIKTGFISFSSSEWLYSLIFLDGVRAILHGVARLERKKEPIQDYLRFELEKSDLCLRKKILKISSQLTLNWPDKFTRYILNNEQIYSNFVSKNAGGSAPYWLSRIIQFNH